MNRTSTLLGTSFDCPCGKRHTIPTRFFHYQSDSLDILSRYLCKEKKNIRFLLIADSRTYEVCGDLLEQKIRDGGGRCRSLIVPDTNGDSPVTDKPTRDWIIRQQLEDEGILIAVGGGVVNDLTKWAAFELNKPFFTVATAASMNGYASANVSATVNGLKILFSAKASNGVFAIPEIIEQAPFELTTSGLGDVVAKPVSSADWKMNQFLFNEYYCQFAVDLLKDLEPEYIEAPQKIKDRDPKAIEALFSALFYSSVAMTITGTSSPASGGEHLFSHTLDIMAQQSGDMHDFHGRQVGVGTILSAALFEEVLKIERPKFYEPVETVDESYWGNLTPVIREEYDKKRDKMMRAGQILSSPANWDAFRETMREQLMPAGKIKNCLKEAGAAHRFSDLRVNNRPADPLSLKNAWLHANQMRSRFTILDLAIMLNLLPEKADSFIQDWVMD